jgi:glutaredoxin
MADITVYGADWCGMTKRTRQHLDRKRIPYTYVDIDRDRGAAKWVAEQNDGREKKPTLDIGGYVLTEPSNEELDQVLREKGFAA